MPTNSSTPNRRPGAPKGNLNALKHGFYSPRFREAEIKDLITLTEPGLTDEISMLRLVIRRTVDRIEDAETLDQHLRCVNTLGHAAAQLSRLLKTQHVLFGEINEIEQALFGALEIINQRKDEEALNDETV